MTGMAVLLLGRPIVRYRDRFAQGESRRFHRRRCRSSLCVHDNRSMGRSTRMIVRIYTGDDGQTHFEDLSLPAEGSHNVALQAAPAWCSAHSLRTIGAI